MCSAVLLVLGLVVNIEFVVAVDEKGCMVKAMCVRVSDKPFHNILICMLME